MTDNDSARELLLSLIYPATKADMSATQAAQFEIAASEQYEYAAQYTGEIESESVGDVKISYSKTGGKNSPLMYYGQPISPSAIVRLTKCGLMRRWV